MFNDRLKNGTRVLVIDKMTKADFIFVLTEDYKEINSYTDIYIEYKNGIQKGGIGFIRNINFDPTTNKDVYLVMEEY